MFGALGDDVEEANHSSVQARLERRKCHVGQRLNVCSR